MALDVVDLHPAGLTAYGVKVRGSEAEERCPWCDQPISRKEFEQIKASLAAEERARMLKLQAEAEAKWNKEAEKLRQDAAAQVEKAKLQAASREAAVRQEATKAATAALAPKLAEAEQARTVMERQLKLAKAKQEEIVNQRLEQQREALERAKSDAINAERARAFKENMKLDAKVQELQRQLQKKTADELGDGAEVDLFAELKREFPGDQLSRVGKGVQGADIVHNVAHNGKICGKIVYDSKNRRAWLNQYVTKLRRDQLAENADHSILSTAVFPAGRRQLYIQDGVIVADPARVAVVVQMLRRQIVQAHVLRLGNDARAEKTARLYEFMISDRCNQLFDQMRTSTEDMLELDAKEANAHRITWKKRGELIRALEKARGDICSEIEDIIGVGEEGAIEALRL
jgi:hypothetical protein